LTGKAVTLKTLVTFYGTNGAQPYAAMIAGTNGDFFGTTSAGGPYNQGTAFSLTPSGVLTTLVSFDGTNGARPLGGLVQGLDGYFYGTTSAGGSNGCGTLFVMNAPGQLATLAWFAGTNGAQPQGALVQNPGDTNLYGTTLSGGAFGLGTVFMLSPPHLPKPPSVVGPSLPLRTSPGVSVLASFDSTNSGANPAAGLALGNDGNLYGTTSAGGSLYNAGTVFKLFPASGTLITLFSFSGTNGAGSQAALVQGAAGGLYGATAGGGTNNTGAGGGGTLFRMTANGAFTSLFSLGGTNGANPFAGLVQGTDGNLYGVTTAGGAHGKGAIFNFSPSSGTLNLLYSFTGGADGAAPYGGLLQGTNGNFYGVTLVGGKGKAGTIYELSGFSPFILTQPTNLAVQSGATVTQAVVAGGSAPLSYRWQYNTNNLSNSRNISGATSAILTITNAAPANSGTYTVVVKNSAGSVTSNPALLSVIEPYGGRPTVRILSPAQNTYLSTRAITVTGTASGTVTVARVFYQLTNQLNGTGWQSATPANPSWSRWTANVTLWPGTNVFQACAVSIQQIFSQTNTAFFVPSPFAQVAGSYNGLFYVTNNVTPTNAGFFSLRATILGKFSGTLQVGGTRYPLSGQFDPSGLGRASIPRPKLDPLALWLQLDMTQGTEQITGLVSNQTWVAELTGERAVFDGHTSIAPQKGRYTLVIPGADSRPEPAGDSWGTVTVDGAGTIRLTASLADGTPVSQGVAVSRDGQWPLYASLYGGQGLLLGWLAFSSNSNADLAGEVVWLKPSLRATRYYSSGLTLRTNVSGSPFTVPARGTNLLNATNAVVTLDGGNLTQTITNRITLDANNRVANQSANKLSLSFSLSDGSFKGAVVDPVSSRSIPFKGVVLENQGYAAGYFLGTNNQSGQVLLAP
jgi:uncharacterized repeat protein (TIGR03803 family)